MRDSSKHADGAQIGAQMLGGLETFTFQPKLKRGSFNLSYGQIRWSQTVSDKVTTKALILQTSVNIWEIREYNNIV